MDEELEARAPDHEPVPAGAAELVAKRAATALAPGRMPAIYLGHGAPPLVDDPLWVIQLEAWARALPRPRAILMVSAHWESAPLTIGATNDGVPLIYDFGGFAERYYHARYPAPGAPELAGQGRGLLSGLEPVDGQPLRGRGGLAERYHPAMYPAPGAPELAGQVRGLLSGLEPVADQPRRGLDHGAYMPLTVMYPGADIPVLQISMPALDPGRLLRIGEVLAPLRDEGVLVIGSGFLTHGLPFLKEFRFDAPPPGWSTEFDHWAAEALDHGDVDALADFRRAPGARYAHPSAEHFAPIFVTLGAASGGPAPATTITSYWLGLAKRSIQVA